MHVRPGRRNQRREAKVALAHAASHWCFWKNVFQSSGSWRKSGESGKMGLFRPEASALSRGKLNPQGVLPASLLLFLKALDFYSYLCIRLRTEAGGNSKAKLFIVYTVSLCIIIR